MVILNWHCCCDKCGNSHIQLPPWQGCIWWRWKQCWTALYSILHHGTALLDPTALLSTVVMFFTALHCTALHCTAHICSALICTNCTAMLLNALHYIASKMHLANWCWLRRYVWKIADNSRYSHLREPTSGQKIVLI